MPNPEQLAYLAGIIDGEGSIVIARFNLKSKKSGKIYPRTELRVLIYNCDPRLMIWICELFSGHSMSVTRRPREGKRREYYMWSAHCAAASVLLQAVLPYLVIKAEQAQLAIEYQETKSHKRNARGVKPETEEVRESLMGKLHILNARGENAVDRRGCFQTFKEGRKIQQAS